MQREDNKMSYDVGWALRPCTPVALALPRDSGIHLSFWTDLEGVKLCKKFVNFAEKMMGFIIWRK